MARAIITLTTDFGGGSHYVAAMKGAILGIHPEVTIVDLTHEVWPQDVRSAAWILAATAGEFPPGTIHVAVVDPGVGTERAIVVAEIDGQRFVAPDNGLLGLVATRGQVERLHRVTQPQYWRGDVSATFHGRDVMGPVAAHLSLGVDVASLGPAHDGLVALGWTQPHCAGRSISGEIVFVDTFGNLISNIDRGTLAAVPRDAVPTVTCGEAADIDFVTTYADRANDTPVALVGSSGYLEVAVVGGDASRSLDAGVGTTIALRW
ncbi:MAG: SAM-dependent chlorinase/fluorinase [Planctomycetales bacterium]|nr:SAM-dependent chlorinase/fluorinase [Planctomycetales bacterium]